MTARSAYRTAPVLLTLGAALLISGCSSSGGNAAASNSAPVSSSAPTAPASSAPAASAPAASAPASSAPASSASQAATVTKIEIKDFAYKVSAPAGAGSMVQVTNNDSEAHTVTADTDKAFDVTVQPGKTENFAAPNKAGSYKFHCEFHSNMHGTLMVSG